MNQWKDLNKEPPKDDGRLLLGCHWLSGRLVMHICKSNPENQWWCGEKTEDFELPIFDSIAPSIGRGESPYWMEIPKDQWRNLNIKEIDEYKDYIIKLADNTYYIADIKDVYFYPSFSDFRPGYTENIIKIRDIPAPPKCNPKIYTEKELKERSLKRDKYLKSFYESLERLDK